MPRVFLQLTQSMEFQGKTEEFSNVYTLESGVDFSDDWSGVAQALVALHKKIQHTGVKYVRYTVWNATGSKNERVIIDAGDLTGTGSLGTSQMYRECAVRFTWQLPRSPVLKRFREMSKWIHGIGQSAVGDTDAYTGQLPIPEAMKTRLLNDYGIPLAQANAGSPTLQGVAFVNVDGTIPGQPNINRFLEHRQFHEGKKRKKSATPPAS